MTIRAVNKHTLLAPLGSDIKSFPAPLKQPNQHIISCWHLLLPGVAAVLPTTGPSNKMVQHKCNFYKYKKKAVTKTMC